VVRILIENRPYEVREDQNLLQACLSLGFNIPYFCWHPALCSVGACRQCAVKQFKDENDKQGRIVMSCMTPVADGMRVSVHDEEARAFRASIIEWLMTNHPHDCPICDEGGECHLQDMTVMTGHVNRRYRFAKRTYNNQRLGPFINHEMNRCIQCYRCVRFYCDYAGGRDFGAFACHNHVYFGRHEDGILENEFSGNLVEVCPTGVFTDKTLKQHYTRPWDLQTSPSICVHCGLGCNIIPGERYGQLRRIRNRYNGAVNGYFLCDRGRYGYEFVNGAQRVREVMWRRPDASALGATIKADVLAYLGKIARAGKVIGIGSPRASLESNFALRALVGENRFYMGVPRSELRLLRAMVEMLRSGPAPPASLNNVGKADAVLVLGEDITNVAPIMALRLRQAIRNEPMKIAAKLGIPAWNDAAVREAVQEVRGPLFQAVPCATKLGECAAHTYYGAPDDIARLGLAIANALGHQSPLVPDLSEENRVLAASIACTLASAQRPLVVSGPSCGSEAIIGAAHAVAAALCGAGRHATLCYTFPECNSFGAAMMTSSSIDDAFDGVGEADAVICLENDLFRRMGAAAVSEFLDAAKHLVVIDHTLHETAARAEIVFPAAAFPEGDGTLVNNEGRAQRFIQTYVPQGDIRESWRWLGEIRAVATSEPAWKNLDEILSALAAALPHFKKALEIAPRADARFVGQRLPRQPHRFSGRTAMNAHIKVSEPKLPDDPDSPFTFSMEGYRGPAPASVIPSFWTPGWNSVQSLNKFQEEIAGPLRGGDPGVRLIEMGEPASGMQISEVPSAFTPRLPEVLLVPLYHIFGSEELSSLSPSIGERIPQPYLALSAEDAAALDVREGSAIEVELEGTIYKVPVAVRARVPSGVAGMPVGLPGLRVTGLPAWGRIIRGSVT